ncbi:MAG: hypothetical protein OJF60_000097 [Burkholderiaceae bacterium]|nr:MAG: hypothetical protein OJF60_000097 [Burkholderiaceae bacterium]
MNSCAKSACSRRVYLIFSYQHNSNPFVNVALRWTAVGGASVGAARGRDV